jgi:hypothetical protein
MWRLGCGGVKRQPHVVFAGSHAGVLISPNIEAHPMHLVTLAENPLPAEGVTIGPFRLFLAGRVEFLRRVSPIFVPQPHFPVTRSFQDC